MSTDKDRTRHEFGMPEASTGTTTEPQSLMRQLRDANENLVISSMRAQEVADEAETATRLKDEFLAVVSRELRTPLSAVLGWARLLGSGTFDPQRTKDAIHTIERNAKALAQIIDDLLDISPLCGGQFRIDL